jgi:hypothetical protein
MNKDVLTKTLPSLIIRPQTAEEAFAYVKNLVGKMPFYREHGYTIELPNSKSFQDILSSTASSENIDWTKEWNIFHSHEYDASAFSAGIDRLNSELPTLDKAWPILAKFSELWGFDLHPKYTVLLTLYGMGGSYNVENSRAIIKTNREGVFKRSVPAHTILHEIVHIGIENPIVRRFRLNHTEKERVVDKICKIGLRDVLRDYAVSPRGDANVDPYVNEETVQNLPSAIEKYVQIFPRNG